MVPERDAELFHDEYVLQPLNVWSLVSFFLISQLQGHLSHKKVVVNIDVCISHYPHILKRDSQFTIDDDAINLAQGWSVR